MAGEITRGDLLYHAVHGVCRVQEIVKQVRSDEEVSYCAMVPHRTQTSQVRFLVALEEIDLSGFHELISLEEAEKIVEYFKAGHTSPVEAPVSFAQDTRTWALAKTLMLCSRDEVVAKDQKRRQFLSRSAKGLIGELAFVFNVPLKKAALMVQSHLARTARINPTVLAALAQISED